MENSVWIKRGTGEDQMRILVKLSDIQLKRLREIVLEKKISATEAYDILMAEQK